MSDSTNPPPPHPHSSNERVEAQSRPIARRNFLGWRKRIGIALLFAVIAAVGFAYLQKRQTPRYTARATMRFEKPDSATDTIGAKEILDGDAALGIETLVEILRSTFLRTRVVESFTPEERKSLERVLRKRTTSNENLLASGEWLGDLEFSRIGRSQLILVEVTHENPEAAALVANRYVAHLINHFTQSAAGMTGSAVDFLKERLETLQRESEQAAQDLQRYQQANNLITLRTSQDIVAQNLATVSAKLTQDRLALAEIEIAARQAESFRSEKKDLFAIPYFANHGSVPVLKAQLSALLNEQTLLGVRYLERHYKMVEIADKIRGTEEQLEKAVELAGLALKTQLDEIRQRIKSLEAEYTLREKENVSLRALSDDYNRLEIQADAKKASYLAALNRFNAALTTPGRPTIPISPLDSATVPTAPVIANVKSIAQRSAGFGALVFLGFVVALSWFERRSRTA